MIQWTIKHGENESVIETGPVTILKSAHSHWFQLVRYIADYFERKQSMVEIYEDTLPLYKKDWDCLFIPFDAHIELTKLTLKSPLKPIVDHLVERVSLSPSFYQLQETWHDLNEELLLFTDDMERYGLTAQLEPFTEDDLKKFIVLKSVKSLMTPIDFKIMLLNLFVEQKVDKKRLIILELPELYSEKTEFSRFLQTIHSCADKGIKFIIVTQENIKGHVNYLHTNVILNEAVIELNSHKIMNSLPFTCDQELYTKAKTTLLKAVDNSSDLNEIINKIVINDEALATIILVLLREMNIPLNLDISRFSRNIQAFLNAS